MFIVHEEYKDFNINMFINHSDIDALIDGELSYEEEQRVLNAVDANPSMKRYYKTMLHQKSLLQDWWVQTGKTQN